MSKCLFLIAGAILAVAASPTYAESPGTASRTVAFADLDLSTEAGRITLDRRVGAAVRHVCGEAWPIDLPAVEQVRGCRSNAYAAAMREAGLGRVYVAQAAQHGARPASAEARMR